MCSDDHTTGGHLWPCPFSPPCPPGGDLSPFPSASLAGYAAPYGYNAAAAAAPAYGTSCPFPCLPYISPHSQARGEGKVCVGAPGASLDGHQPSCSSRCGLFLLVCFCLTAKELLILTACSLPPFLSPPRAGPGSPCLPRLRNGHFMLHSKPLKGPSLRPVSESMLASLPPALQGPLWFTKVLRCCRLPMGMWDPLRGWAFPLPLPSFPSLSGGRWELPSLLSGGTPDWRKGLPPHKPTWSLMIVAPRRGEGSCLWAPGLILQSPEPQIFSHEALAALPCFQEPGKPFWNW